MGKAGEEMIFIVLFFLVGLCSVFVNTVTYITSGIPVTINSIILAFFGFQIFWIIFIPIILNADKGNE